MRRICMACAAVCLLGCGGIFGGRGLFGPGDRDGDGIADDVDRCPDEPEDFDGFEDEDGCPEPDNDRDGILDRDDKCPNQPETHNGYQDEDGCPDSLPVASKPCGTVSCGPNEYCEIRCTCCGTMVPQKPSATHACKPIPGGCSAASFCACTSIASSGLCSDGERSINIPCA